MTFTISAVGEKNVEFLLISVSAIIRCFHFLPNWSSPLDSVHTLLVFFSGFFCISTLCLISFLTAFIYKRMSDCAVIVSLFFQCFITNKFSSKHQPVMAPGPLTGWFEFCGFIIYFCVLVLYCFFFSVWYYFRALWSIACYLLCPLGPGLISVFSQSCLCVFPFLFWSYVIFSYFNRVSSRAFAFPGSLLGFSSAVFLRCSALPLPQYVL